MTEHEKYMQRCIQLALKGAGHVAPNPLVGAVIVRQGHIIGEGWHREFGGPHAEVNAINGVADKRLLTESTIYVNLEPSSHFGKTPPCSDLIIASKIPRVVIGTTDPNPLVKGNGIKKLIEHGTDVTIGVLENECIHLNRRFFTWINKKRPFIILKWAQSADGYIDHVRENHTKERAIISSPESHELLHKWRAEEAAILVGTNTVISDNPRLTVRLINGKNPVRVTFDRKGRIPPDAHILDGSAPTIVFTQDKNLITDRAVYIKIDFEKVPIHEAMEVLYQKNLQSVLVEGGAAILNRFISEGLWDEARVFIADKKFGNGIKAPLLDHPVAEENVSGPDKLLIHYNR